MKLNKFEVEQLSIAEMEAIRAGSGISCITGSWICRSETSDQDNSSGDSDAD